MAGNRIVEPMMQKKVIVASHRRSGTHLTIDAIQNNFNVFQANPPINDLTLDNLSRHLVHSELCCDEIQRRIEGASCVMKTHAHGKISAFFQGDLDLREFVSNLFAQSKIIYVLRDGRDVMVSQYFYQQCFDERTKEISFSQYLREENNFDRETYDGALNRVQYWVFHLNSWISNENCLKISFDDLEKRYRATLQKVSEFIDEPLNRPISDNRMSTNRLAKSFSNFKRKLLPGKQEIRHSSVSFRKGKSRDWKNHFSKSDLEFFDRYSDGLNRELGYK